MGVKRPSIVADMAKSQVTVRVPEEIKVFAQRVADESGRPMSVVLAEALGQWVRWRAFDELLREWRAEDGPYDEDKLKAVAEEHGMPYVPPICPVCAV
jgi:hypothetical protein